MSRQVQSGPHSPGPVGHGPGIGDPTYPLPGVRGQRRPPRTSDVEPDPRRPLAGRLRPAAPSWRRRWSSLAGRHRGPRIAPHRATRPLERDLERNADAAPAVLASGARAHRPGRGGRRPPLGRTQHAGHHRGQLPVRARAAAAGRALRASGDRAGASSSGFWERSTGSRCPSASSCTWCPPTPARRRTSRRRSPRGLTQALAGMAVAFSNSLVGIVSAVVLTVLGVCPTSPTAGRR